MTLTIRYPKVLLALLALFVIAGTAYTVMADNGNEDPPLEITPVGGDAELPRVEEDEKERALETLANSPDFARATRGHAWELVSEHPNTRDGEKVGIALILKVESPFDSDGPWIDRYCQGAVTQRFTFPYQGISQISTVFDESGELVGLRPLADFSAPSGTPALRFPEDAPTVAVPECPEGFEDEEN